MSNKFSYLATVSVIASMAMLQPGHAMDEPPAPKITVAPKGKEEAAPQKAIAVRQNETKDLDDLDDFCVMDVKPAPQQTPYIPHLERETKKAIYATLPKDHSGLMAMTENFFISQTQKANALLQQERDVASVPVSTGAWLMSKASYLAHKLGDGLRWTGEQVRDNSFVGEVLVQELITQGTNTELVGDRGAQLTKKVVANPSVLKRGAIFTGNLIRGTGALFSGETPTLIRSYLDFGTATGMLNDPEEFHKEVYLNLLESSEYIDHIDKVNSIYAEFNEACGKRSPTFSLGDAQVQKCKLRAMVKFCALFYAANNMQEEIDSDSFCLQITKDLEVAGFNYELEEAFSKKAIEAEILRDEATSESKTAAKDMPKKIKENRRIKLLEDFVKPLFEIESEKLSLNQRRQKRITPPAQPALSQPAPVLAIEAPAPQFLETISASRIDSAHTSEESDAEDVNVLKTKAAPLPGVDMKKAD